jgi:hypothetical protein
MVPQPFVVGGNRSYSELWVVTGSSNYPRYKTLTVAPELSVEQAAETIFLTGG